MPIYITVLMLLIVIALAIYALALCLKLLKQRRHQAKQLEQQAQTAQAKRVDAQASIEILLRCPLQDQVSLTEAAIRVSGLAKVLRNSEVEQSFYAPFDALAMATSHIPILEDWKKLPAKQKREFDIERATIESEHRERVINAAKQLIQPQ